VVWSTSNVKKLGNIPAGGGWKMLGRAVGNHNHSADKSSGRRSKHGHLRGHAYIHAAATIPAWPTARSMTTKLARQPLDSGAGRTLVRRLRHHGPASPDRHGNGGCYRSHLWRDTLADLAVDHLRTRPSEQLVDVEVAGTTHEARRRG
jgi:hypothetical protein